jgi:hypothetical protein
VSLDDKVKGMGLKPVPKRAVGRRVGDYPAKQVYRKVPSLVLGQEHLVHAHAETVIEDGDLWRIRKPRK